MQVDFFVAVSWLFFFVKYFVEHLKKRKLTEFHIAVTKYRKRAYKDN